MNDLISRQDAIRIASGYCHPANIAEELAKLPSADVVEVVRCKDCIYSHTDIYYGEECLTCENTDGLCCDVYKEDYCSMGERRTDGEIH